MRLKDLSIESIDGILKEQQYVADKEISTAILLSLRLQKPLLIEGEPGCGKTEIAKVLSNALDTPLIRLQCYEGLTANETLYEWDYLRQMLKIRLEEKRKEPREVESEIFGERYLLKRPLLRALLHDGPRPAVLLIDEIDRADEEFEGFLLEFLSEFQVTIPEYSTIRAKRPPVVIITSNRTRELGDGLRRRCLYLYIGYPSFEKELLIVRTKIPGAGENLSAQICEAVRRIREHEGMVKRPGVAETLDWMQGLIALGKRELDVEGAERTLSCVVKSAEDKQRLSGASLREIVTQSSGARGGM